MIHEINKAIIQRLACWGRGGGYANGDTIGHGSGDGTYWRMTYGSGIEYEGAGGADGESRDYITRLGDYGDPGLPGLECYAVQWTTPAVVQLNGGDVFAECLYLRQRKKRLA